MSNSGFKRESEVERPVKARLEEKGYIVHRESTLSKVRTRDTSEEKNNQY